MSYYAQSEGTITLKKDNAKEVVTILDGLSPFEAEANSENTASLLSSDRWYPEDVKASLDAIAPHVEEGEITFTGEDGCNWRYIFKDGEWVEQNGCIYYSEEDMIKALEKSGYKIIKEIV